MPGRIFNQFVLPNIRESMISSLREIRAFIYEFLPADAASEQLGFKIEMVITELLTNALKHVKNAETCMRIYLDDNYLTIEKTDFGSQFNPENFADIFKQAPGYKKLLTYDELHSIYAVVEMNNTVRFTCEQNDNKKEVDINAINEHFGMVIISRSAEAFTYHYDIASGLNRFTVRMRLAE
ncbi:ATP-binding protein [Mucilaginibacter calamicampi]|uniref:ATP-binding protein n=1 Tax=Mucilaginibacter calamicampi TaxID=1302352 RepID=A0ABW2YSZ6_9SPHI